MHVNHPRARNFENRAVNVRTYEHLLFAQDRTLPAMLRRE